MKTNDAINTIHTNCKKIQMDKDDKGKIKSRCILQDIPRSSIVHLQCVRFPVGSLTLRCTLDMSCACLCIFHIFWCIKINDSNSYKT